MNLGTCSECEHEGKTLYSCEFCCVEFCLTCFIEHFKTHDGDTCETD